MSQYKSRDLQSIFDVSGETIRVWADEFSTYLSPSATPGSGKHRIFSDEDLTVFALISEMKALGKTFEDVHVSLRTGQRGDLPSVIGQGRDRTESAIQVAVFRQQLDQVRSERDQAVEQAQQLHDEVIKLRTQLQYHADQDDKIDELNGKISELSKQIGRLEALLEVERDRNKHDNTD